MKKNMYEKSSLGELLLVFRRNILENMKKDGFAHDLTFSQAEVLRFIGANKKETMSAIAGYLKITPPSATEIIGEMEKRGLIKRRKDKKDRRLVFITLSDSAKKLFVSSLRHKESVLKKMTSKLSKKDRENLERIIRILITV
ncbi:MAG: MarR family transcriptional regulator [Minisyncoccia bacterium]